MVEGLPKGGGLGQFVYYEGCTDGCPEPPTIDLNGDKRSDMLYRNFANGLVYRMQMEGFLIANPGQAHFEPNLAWKIVGDGDFNGDGITDLLWRNDSTGQVFMIRMDGLAVAGAAMVYQEPNTSWKILGPWEYAQ